MRLLILFALPALFLSAPAISDEWSSRGHGPCFDWRGHWRVDRDPSGVWVGEIRFRHVGGPCTRPTPGGQTDEVRAVIVGDQFFARRQSQSAVCLLNGRVQGDEVRGRELCTSVNGPMEFTLYLGGRGPGPRDDNDDDWRDDQGPPPDSRYRR